MEKIGIYPGTFDPMTNGHLNIIERSFKIVDKLIIGVADNSNKTSLLSIKERKDIINNDINSMATGYKNTQINKCYQIKQTTNTYINFSILLTKLQLVLAHPFLLVF